MQSQTFAILVVLGVIVALWYGFVVYLNAPWQIERYEQVDKDWTMSELIADTMAQERPVLPAAHQVAFELWNTTVEKKVTSKRSLIYHGWITLSATGLGFLFGTILGITLAVVIVHNEAMNRSLMPWIIASQTIPILAIAPMIIVVLNAVGLSGLLPKALISTYLSFFGRGRHERCAARILQLDLMRTYSASSAEDLLETQMAERGSVSLHVMKVAVAISLVGAIVGNCRQVRLPDWAAALAGSYYGQTIQIWSPCFAAALAAVLVMLVGFAQSMVMKRMGMAETSPVEVDHEPSPSGPVRSGGTPRGAL